MDTDSVTASGIIHILSGREPEGSMGNPESLNCLEVINPAGAAFAGTASASEDLKWRAGQVTQEGASIVVDSAGRSLRMLPDTNRHGQTATAIRAALKRTSPPPLPLHGPAPGARAQELLSPAPFKTIRGTATEQL